VYVNDDRSFWSYATPSEKYKQTKLCGILLEAHKVYTQVLQWGSDLQDWNTADVLLLADCVYYMEVSVLTIITVEYKIRKYVGH